MAVEWNDQSEWLETDGLGGFASGTAGGIRTRRYHGLLVTDSPQHPGRVMLVNGFDSFLTTPTGRYPLSSHRYDGQVVYPEGFRSIESFSTDPCPTWQFRLPDGTRIAQQICMQPGNAQVVISWRLLNAAAGVRLEVRPLLSGRDYHALHRENPDFYFEAHRSEGLVRWRPYPSLPSIVAKFNGVYRHDPQWYRRFFYQEEWLRGFEATEDLASPGELTWEFGKNAAVLVLSAGDDAAKSNCSATQIARTVSAAEVSRRSDFESPLHRAADQFIVQGRHGQAIIAGYPWFGEWGRDSFIALRGLCLATGRYDDATQILLRWADHISMGMMPNWFPDGTLAPEYNSVDAALWYGVAVHELLAAADRSAFNLAATSRAHLQQAVEAILTGYTAATRHGIRVDDDGLLAAGGPGVQLTWMDARVDGQCITPRIGKPVEVQALWINALWAAGTFTDKWNGLCAKAYQSFREKFWNPATGGLFDVIDCDHRPGAVDPTFRPNQIFGVGGLPLVLLEPARALSVVREVERRLWTPLGLRSLAPDEPRYTPRYSGDPRTRDAAYHQGTVWPWLIGPFAEAWARTRGYTAVAKADATKRFIAPLLGHTRSAGLGHVSEIADGDAPHMPRGCPFQAWSVGELLRVQRTLQSDPCSATLAQEPTQGPALEVVGHPICG